MSKDEEDKFDAKVKELLKEMLGSMCADFATKVIDEAKNNLEAADKVGENVVAIGCECKTDHKKHIIYALHPKTLQMLLEGKETIHIDFSKLGVNVMLTLGSGPTYEDLGVNVINYIREHYPDDYFALSRPTGVKELLEFGPAVKFGSLESPTADKQTPEDKCEYTNHTKH